MKRFFAIGFIWVGCALAWLILGGTLVERTGESPSELLNEVHGLWGPPITQQPPFAAYKETQRVEEMVTTYAPDGKPIQTRVERPQVVSIPIPLQGTDIAADLSLKERQKGLLWFATYAATFRGKFTFENNSGKPREIELRFPIARDNAGLDGFTVLADGKPVAFQIEPDDALWIAPFAAGQKREYEVRFRTRGISSWQYAMAGNTGQVKSFHLAMNTNFDRIDFPTGSLSPTQHTRTAEGWTGVWDFASLITSARVGIGLPHPLNPGPVASRITFFAPVGLLFFFFVISILALARNVRLHPANYFFLGCAFFAFHLLFAYLVDHLALPVAFGIASGVSLFLVMSYGRLFVGWTFALREMGLSQLVYLVLFSFTFFWDGFTGLAITVGAVLTLFAMMQVTGRMRWGTGTAIDPRTA